MNPFNYNDNGSKLNLHLVEEKPDWTRYRFDFPSAHISKYPEHNIIYGEYYRPGGEGKWPLAVVVHGMGDRSTVPCRMIARDLAKQGIASFIIYLVFHSSRMPKSIKKRMPFLTPEEWFQGYQTSVIDIRQLLDRAAELDEIDSSKLAVIGMSFGGFVSSIAMGVDDRINAGIIMLAGGNYESRAWRRLLRMKFTEEELQEALEQYQNYISELEAKGLDNTAPPKKSYLTDPVTFGHRLRERPVMMINAKWDERIPRQTTLDMWESFGKPPIKWVPGTHSTMWALFPWYRREISGFLSSSFDL